MVRRVGGRTLSSSLSLTVVLGTSLVTGCGRVGFEATTGDEAPGPTLQVAVGVEGRSSGQVVFLDYRPAASPASAIAGATALELPVGNRLRALAAFDSSSIVAAGTSSTAVFDIDWESQAVARTPVLSAGVANVHGLCTLPNGHLIAGEFSGMPGAAVTEHDSEGSFVREVYRTQISGGTMSECQALSSAELLLTDEDANTDADGDVVHLKRQGGSWIETARLDMSSYGTTRYGEQHQTGIAAFVAVGESVYAFPIRRLPGRIPNLIECRLPDLDSCVERGPLPEDSEPTLNGPGTLMGAAAVPGGNQLLFVTNRGLYRYDLETDDVEQIVSADELPLAGGDSPRNLRHVVVAPL